MTNRLKSKRKPAFPKTSFVLIPNPTLARNFVPLFPMESPNLRSRPRPAVKNGVVPARGGVEHKVRRINDPSVPANPLCYHRGSEVGQIVFESKGREILLMPQSQHVEISEVDLTCLLAQGTP